MSLMTERPGGRQRVTAPPSRDPGRGPGRPLWGRLKSMTSVARRRRSHEDAARKGRFGSWLRLNGATRQHVQRPCAARPDRDSRGLRRVGDQSLHYVEAGEGPLVVLLHGFPEFWFGWRLQIAPLAAAGFRVVAPDTRGYNLSSKPEGFEAYGVDLLADDIRGLIGELGADSALWSVTTGADDRLDDRDEPPGGRRPARHPERGPSAAALEGLKHPNQLRKSWYFFFFATPGTARGRRACQGLALLPPLPAGREPPVHAGGDRTLRRGVVAAGRSGRDDQLLPRLGRQSQKEAQRSFARSRHRPWSSGASATATSAPISRSRSTTTCPTSSASSGCPMRRTGSITTRPSASTNC